MAEPRDEDYVLTFVIEFPGEAFEVVRLLQSEGWERIAAMRIVAKAIEQRNAIAAGQKERGSDD